MHTLTKGIELQPDFPVEDLSEMNREIITLMLLNARLVENGHRAAEAASWMFRTSHPAIAQGMGRVYADERRVTAVSHGVSVFESTSAFVGVAPQTSDTVEELTISHSAVLFARTEEPDALTARAGDALDSLREEMPNLSELTLEASHRFYGHLAEYALLGAALARDFVLHAG